VGCCSPEELTAEGTVTTEFERRRAALGARLRDLRARTSLTGRDLADALGRPWTQSKVSKVETGAQTPTDAEVIAWCRALAVPDDVRAELLADLADLRVHQAAWRQQLRRGHRARQDEIGGIEQATTRVRCVEMLAIPGLLQTAEYARAVFTTQARLHGAGADIDEAVRARLERQRVLYEPGRSFEFILAESAFAHPVCGPDVLRGQLARIIAAIGTPGVRLGVLPARHRLPVTVMHGWAILDERLVLADHMTAELRITDPEQVATYHRITDLLWSVAAEGDAARAVLTRVADHL
jgi:transcriptional regulator with XRE-family HTH domain